MILRIMGKDYPPEYVERAVLFYEHLEKHKEVQEAPTHRGIPMCMICRKDGEEIHQEERK